MKPTIALFMNNPVADVACCNGMMEALEDYYRFTLFSKKTIHEVNFNKVDLVAFPGGTGDADLFHRLLKDKSNIIRKYVNGGGKYLGICMGAYWASKHYFDLLADTNVVQYITRPNAEVRRSYQTTLNITWKRKETNMYFFDGCAFVGDKFRTIARYSNGDAMAIIQKNVGLIGCHPESRQTWYKRKYLRDRWHNYEHHKLLQEFVNELLGL
jgi:glutamine amidotransferase-like uncharacterized protein